MGRPKGSPNKDKPFKEALLLEAALAEDGEESPAHKGSLRWIARRLLERSGDDTQCLRAARARDTEAFHTHLGISD
jgi:hypothetical protein